MEKYNPQKIEEKWAKFWEKHPELYSAKNDPKKSKKYILDMFPYPSGDGLHVGHVESYTATDIMSRYLRMSGKNVLHPQGWDAFGLPAENYAIKTKVHPAETTKKAINNFKRQMNSMGFSYDWSREVNSSDPNYYKWTQWFFLLLYKNKLAYKAKAKVNWCESCKTVLANEQVIDGKCERCGNLVVQKDLEQWFFKITDFIEDRPHPDPLLSKEKEVTSGLINGLEKVDWPESTKAAQKNWIGKSEGAEIEFGILNSARLPAKQEFRIKVYTTRIDTIYGCTYCVIAPEHKIISNLKSQISNFDEIEEYIKNTKKKSDLDRMENKDKTGVEVKGIKVINPFTKEELPLFVADYVLAQYGTGAVMAVPAHDERDWEFAKKYNLPIRQSISSQKESFEGTTKTLEVLKKIYEAARKEDIKFWVLGGLANAFYAGIIYRKHEDLDLIAKDEESRGKLVSLMEGIGFKKIKEKKLSDNLTNFIFENEDGVEIDIGPYLKEFGLADDDFEEDEKDLNGYKSLIISKKFVKSFKEFQLKNRTEEKDRLDLEYLNGKVFVDDGVLVNSDKYSGLTSEEAREKMAEWLVENNLGHKKINYKIRDWLVSRQRYWGAPIPVIYCDKCGEVPVSEKDLPVMLPTDVDFKPTGESPLKYSKEFQNVKCPKCGADAKRESDTMDTFVCSSWYYFRYADPKNEKEFASKDLIKKWLPVDLYVGGAEHTVLHLLYSRFFTKVLHNLGYIGFDEPFLKLRHQGIILSEDGRKMSKSLGNVVNPDDEVKKFGADALRLFEMFMGPLEDMKPWQTNGLVGTYRFLEKAWKLKTSHFGGGILEAENNDKEADIIINKTIKKVTEDIESLKFNTAISELMIALNRIQNLILRNTLSDEVKNNFREKYLIILSPFAPFIAEEIWEKLGHKESIFKEAWPKYDEKLIQDEEIDLVIQINGKVRDKIKVSANLDEEEAKKMALESEKVKNHIEGKKIKKVIFVRGKLVSIVI
ncbi:MAG TPA: class I tRNA ligase family protein [Candidatus Moranbacteria bacterium]|nr:class I tRNA ligase family protein [Candidatus Moranbacteria bacterium]